jgi:hypothetical protein
MAAGSSLTAISHKLLEQRTCDFVQGQITLKLELLYKGSYMLISENMVMACNVHLTHVTQPETKENNANNDK